MTLATHAYSTSAEAAADIRREVEDLYRREVRLLQAGKYQEWLGIFSPDLRYRMPVVGVREVREEVVGKDDHLALFDDDFNTLTLRVRRLYSSMAWTEVPPSRLRYFISVLDVEPIADGAWQVTSNFLLHQARREHERYFFVGERVDQMRRADDDGDGDWPWKVFNRLAVLDEAILSAQNISVFF